MKRPVRLIAAMLCLLMLTGCACEHEWKDADCLNAAVCAKCGETNGEPMGHAPGPLTERFDISTATTVREQTCEVCGVQTGLESVPAQSLIRDGMFLFTPVEFMDRLTYIAQLHGDTFTCEFVRSDISLQVMTYSGEKRSLIQFFHADTTALTATEENAAVVWCVNHAAIGELDADFRLYFLMACDPMLDMESVEATGQQTAKAGLEALQKGELFGYYVENGLLYEAFSVPEDVMGQGYSLDMLNVYASDFR